MIDRIRRCGVCALLAAAALWLPVTAWAIEIDGVQNASLDQPHIFAALRLPGDDDPLTWTDPDSGLSTFNIRGFFDTGASGVLISKETADHLGLPLEPNVEFHDVGVAGVQSFNVSVPVEVRLADFADGVDADNPATFEQTYSHSYGPLRTQVFQTLAPPLTPALDVFGMPLFQGKTVVVDARKLNVTGLDYLEARIYDSGNVPQTAPTPDYHVQMSFGDFSRFTQTLENGVPNPAMAPLLADNPFIGANPVSDDTQPDAPPGIRTVHNGEIVESNWLFDTGAAASIISEHVAAQHGVTVADDEGTPVLMQDGQVIQDQFFLGLQGVGGARIVAGFWLDGLILPTVEGEDIVFNRAPVIVADISVKDPLTGEVVTLDGIFGMNFLAASGFVDFLTSPLPSNLTAGAFDYFQYDQVSNQLGLMVNDAFIPEPGTLVLIVAGVPLFVMRRRGG